MRILAGPVLLTVVWLAVVSWRRRVPIWLVPGECGFCLAVFWLSMTLTDPSSDISFLGHGTRPATSREELVGALLMNSFSGLLWCVVLAAVSLPIVLVQAFRRGPEVLDVPSQSAC